MPRGALAVPASPSRPAGWPSLWTMTISTCPGCGLVSSEAGIPLDRPLNASSACWGIHAEVVGFELGHPGLVARCHQLTVDAYGAQHAGPQTARIYLAYSLVGLHLALDRGWSGGRVRDFHQRIGRPADWWPDFGRSARQGGLTVAEVVEAGARAGSAEGHASLVERWAAEVWAGWADHQRSVELLTARLERVWDRTSA